MNNNKKKNGLESEDTKKDEKAENVVKDSEEEKKHSNNNEEKILLIAEIENMKKRHLKEKSDVIRYSNQKLIGKIIPLLDNYETALKTSELVKDENVQKFLSGILMAVEDFRNSLKTEGVEEYKIEVKKDMWDSIFCEVVDEVENDDYEDGTIIEVFKKGYLLNGRMIRPASVVISKKSSQEKDI